MSCQKHKKESIIVIKVHDKLHENLFFSISLLHWNNESSREYVLKKAYGEQLIYWKDIGCRNTLELPLWGNSNVYLQYM